MLLVIDVGNTNITMGVYDGKNLKTTFRMMSKQPRTSDEYGITLRELLRTNEVEKEEIEGVIMASVVPNVMHSLVNGITKYIGRSPMIVGPGVKTGIRVTSENSGRIRRSFRKSRLRSRSPFWHRKPSAVCRPVLYTDRSDRPNTSSVRCVRKAAMTI